VEKKIRRRRVKSGERSEDEIRTSLTAMSSQLNHTFIDREEAVRAIVLSAITGMNYLLVGSPGTAKTALAKAAAQHITGARYFAPSALGAYTTLSDLVGERDIPALMQGVSQRQTEGKLAAVEFAFLDELFKAADPTVNTMLSLLNQGEREFEGAQTPLWSVGSASNWPEVVSMKPVVQAFWDRLHFRVVVKPVTKTESLLKLMRSGRSLMAEGYEAASGTHVTMDEIQVVAKAILSVDVSGMTESLLLSVHKRLNDEKVRVSARRMVQLQLVLQANASFCGLTEVGLGDFSVLSGCLWSCRDDIPKVNAVLSTVDIEVARALMEKISECRQMYRDFNSRGWDEERAHEYLMVASETAQMVATSLSAKQLSETSCTDIRNSMKGSQPETESLLKRFGEHLTK